MVDRVRRTASNGYKRIAVPTYRYAHTDISEINDESLLGLIDEIAERLEVQKRGWVLHFLQQALRPNGGAKDQKFKSTDFLPGGWMHRRISKLGGTEVFWLCHDLARIYNAGSLENYGKTELYSFLNKLMIQKKKKLRARL